MAGAGQLRLQRELLYLNEVLDICRIFPSAVYGMPQSDATEAYSRVALGNREGNCARTGRTVECASRPGVGSTLTISLPRCGMNGDSKN